MELFQIFLSFLKIFMIFDVFLFFFPQKQLLEIAFFYFLKIFELNYLAEKRSKMVSIILQLFLSMELFQVKIDDFWLFRGYFEVLGAGVCSLVANCYKLVFFDATAFWQRPFYYQYGSVQSSRSCQIASRMRKINSSQNSTSIL